ncbi:hypothetical protein F2P56_019831 [Juglans regia]|nr:hypothetical protein F2P56_019831 [Juglans regia]
MLELLNRLDGFALRGAIKAILATNMIEILDPALLQLGLIDIKIEFPLHDIKTRRRVFQIHASRMTSTDDVNLEEFVMNRDEFSRVGIKAIYTEAGLLALRKIFIFYPGGRTIVGKDIAPCAQGASMGDGSEP